MGFEFKKGRYYSHVWFVYWKGCDWLAGIWRDEGESDWHLLYRFRYYKDDKFDLSSEDEKSWTGWSFTGDSPDVAVEIMRKAAEMLTRTNSGAACDELVLNTDDPEKIMSAFGRMAWMHPQVITKGGEA